MRLLLALTILLTMPTVAVQPSAQTAELDSVLAALHADGLFTGALAISKGEEIVYRAAYGEHDGTPLTPQTPLPLASVTKPMTAAVVLTLVAEGRVDLDAAVGSFLNLWPYPDVTVRHLLTQTSGLHFLTTINAHADTPETLTNADVLALVAKHQPIPAFEAGSAFDYDNANYVALGALIEAVTGQTFADALRERVFGPADMDHARVMPVGGSDRIGTGADGVAASVEDLLAFGRAFRAGEVIPLRLVCEAETPPTLAGGIASRYGLGWFLTDYPRPLVGHFGDGVEAKTGLWRERETGTAYAIAMPGDGIHRTPILAAVMALWNGEPYDLPRARPVADVPPEVLARHVGVYDSGMGRLHITLESGRLHLEPEGAGGSEPLIPASETVFYFGGQDLTWEFVTDGVGRTTGLMLQGHPETLGERVE